MLSNSGAGSAEVRSGGRGWRRAQLSGDAFSGGWARSERGGVLMTLGAAALLMVALMIALTAGTPTGRVELGRRRGSLSHRRARMPVFCAGTIRLGRVLHVVS